MNLKQLQNEIGSVKLVAVSKLQPSAKILELYNQGQRRFGENYVQEALEKIDQLKAFKQIEWHFIGHLQKNKVKSVIGKFYLIHSVDSIELAEVMSRQCVLKGISQNVLLQINLSQEQSKGGLEKTMIIERWHELQKLPNLKICGLMTMPPLTETGEEVRHYFNELKELLELLKNKTDITIHPMSELSMGTSHDYPVAIAEGATIIRLGTILFGERQPRG